VIKKWQIAEQEKDPVLMFPQKEALNQDPVQLRELGERKEMMLKAPIIIPSLRKIRR
jgi:hypothetical protein